MGEFAAGVGDGATEGDLDHPAGVDNTAGPVVSFVVTSLECDEVGWTVGRTIIRNVRLQSKKRSYWDYLPVGEPTFALGEASKLPAGEPDAVFFSKNFLFIFTAL